MHQGQAALALLLLSNGSSLLLQLPSSSVDHKIQGFKLRMQQTITAVQLRKCWATSGPHDA